MKGICSWSGGKDSALALQRAWERGVTPVALLTMFDESGERTRSHGLPRAVIEAQAAALKVPLVTRSATWADYTDAFADGLAHGARDADVCVFGDIDIPAHRQWCAQVCARAGVSPLHPLWQHPRRALLEQFLSAGFLATIVVVRDSQLGPAFLGRTLDWPLIHELEVQGVDPCGENGEYHTVVTDGPRFASPLPIRTVGTAHVADCTVLQVTLVESGTDPRAKASSLSSVGCGRRGDETRPPVTRQEPR
jgi:uncharacterized protein (TIGR00290 family)